ncbi:MAG TPA: hypothetical protein VGN17_26760 [Bryobacteraceae bacterium]|jgi:hypothetical protein
MPEKKEQEIQIERLVLKAGAMDAKVAQRLAEQVVAQLQRAPLAGDLPQRAEFVRLQVRPRPGATPDQLSEQILQELMRELRRT